MPRTATVCSAPHGVRPDADPARTVGRLPGRAPATYPVTGRLTIRGQPAAAADLRFFEIHGRAPGMARPYATTDEDGRFTVSTYGIFDGAPAGEYQLAVSWKGPLRGIPSDQRDAMPEMLPPRFTDASTSGLRVQITSGENALDTIDLRP